jgi:hypothetical protein
MLRIRVRHVLATVGFLTLLTTSAFGAPASDPGKDRSFVERLRHAIVHILDDVRVIWPQG